MRVERPGGKGAPFGPGAVSFDPDAIDGKQKQSGEHYGYKWSQVVPKPGDPVEDGVMKVNEVQNRVVSWAWEWPIAIVKRGGREAAEEKEHVSQGHVKSELARRCGCRKRSEGPISRVLQVVGA